MANLKNINLMSQDTFESIEQADDELYAVSASGIGFPSSRYEDLTLGASGTEYTAPANGWFVLSKKSSANNQLASMITSARIRTIFISNGSSQDAYIYVPVQKNNILQVFYSLGGATEYFRFIYAEGE